MRAKIAELEARPSLTDAQRTQLDRLTTAEADATKKVEEAAPDFLQDPKGYVDKNLSNLAKAVESLTKEAKETKQQATEREQFNTDMGRVGAFEQEFRATTPDYNDAIVHMRNVRAQQLAIYYPNATPQQIQQAIMREEVQGALGALKAGVNPAEMAYKYAATMGYVKKAPAPANGSANGANGSQPATAPAIDKEAVKTLGSSGGNQGAVDEDDGQLMQPVFATAIAERFGVKKRKQ